MINELLLTVASASWLFELARLLVRLHHGASFIGAHGGIQSQSAGILKRNRRR
jgi:hypothetical protein